MGQSLAIAMPLELDGFQLPPLDVHLGVANYEDVAVHVSGTTAGSLDLQLHPVSGVDETGPAAVQFLIDHRPQVNQNAELVVCVKLGRIQVARDVLLFVGLSQEKAAGLFPKIVGMGPVVVQHVGRAVDRDGYLCQVGVEIFFRFSGAGCVRLDEEEKDAFQRPSLGVDPQVNPRVRSFRDPHDLFSLNMVVQELLPRVVDAVRIVRQGLASQSFRTQAGCFSVCISAWSRPTLGPPGKPGKGSARTKGRCKKPGGRTRRDP